MSQIEISRKQVAEFCQRHHMRELALFGSVLTDDFHEKSDVDVLVQFMPGEEPGLFALAGMELELSELLGRKVDMRTPDDLSQYFRKEVMRAAEIQYAAV